MSFDANYTYIPTKEYFEDYTQFDYIAEDIKGLEMLRIKEVSDKFKEVVPELKKYLDLN